MVITITNEEVRDIIREILNGRNHRSILTKKINRIFLDTCNEFLHGVASSKSRNPDNDNWYQDVMMRDDLPNEDIALNAGINVKTISNTMGSEARDVVIEASIAHYDWVTEFINNIEDDPGLTFSIPFDENIVNFTTEESLKIINSLSARRGTIARGVNSAVGKNVEKPLLSTICRLLRVDPGLWNQASLLIPVQTRREVDYYIMNQDRAHKCEVKLNGKSKLKSPDVILARRTEFLVAENIPWDFRIELDERNIQWISLSDGDILEQFGNMLDHFEIAYHRFEGDLNEALDELFAQEIQEENDAQNNN